MLVGVEPDVAEEDAVGVRDRLAPQLDRLRAAEAAGEHAQPLAEPRRARAGARLERVLEQAEVRELGRDLRRDEGHRSASTFAASAASPSSLNDVSATTPPRRANVIVGQIATA